jgi:hypothetical protein
MTFPKRWMRLRNRGGLELCVVLSKEDALLVP